MSKRNQNSSRRCSHSGCDAPHEARGLCAKHYWRSKRHGSPDATLTPTRGMTLAEKLAGRSSADPHSGCLLWTGPRTPDGYGIVWHEQTNLLVHREAWKLANGDIPSEMFVCHRCDVRNCINPEHMFLGSPQDNMDDKMMKGRHRTPRGEEHPAAKLTAEAVARIRTDTRPTKIIADEFGVSEGAIRHVRKLDTWRGLPCD